MSGLLNNLIECSICYENKTPYYSDNVGCMNYKKICIDCVPLLRSNNCPFCREVHHVREIDYDENEDILDNTNDDVTSYMQMMYETVIRIINENYHNNPNNEVERGRNNINNNNSALNNAIERASNFNNNNFSLNNVNEMSSNNYITIENNNNYILNNYNYNNNINSINRSNNNNARYLDLPSNLNDIFTENEINLESFLLNDNINIDNINIDNILNNDLDVISDAILRASIN